MTKPAGEHSPAVDDTVQAGIIWLLRLSLILASAYTALIGSWETALISLLALGFTWLPHLLENHYKLRLPIEYELIIVAFIYASIFLGEVGGAYERFWWWDIILHLSSGLVLAFSGFLVVYGLHRQDKLTTSPFLISLFAFSFSLAAGAAWEIFEFLADMAFGLNMQKSGLRDTMSDLIVVAFGALIVARMIYVYVKTGKGGLFTQFMRTFLNHNPKLRLKGRRNG